ncbi:MAG TPA: hypothetical protein VLK30_03530 [Candidatus Limnocylindrales bacterium]|nr:hypothetical protein [Candidatus Limnocylindrales bacterium]
MDAEEPVLGLRARRAVPLIAAALTVAVVAGLLYLHATTPQSPRIVQGRATIVPPSLSRVYGAAFDFVSPADGWAVVRQQQGGNPQAWLNRTADGGRHWARVFRVNSAELAPLFIHFFDTRNGMFYNGRLYRTSDGGAHWTVISLPDATPNFTFASTTRGWALDSEFDPAQASTLYATDDGGLTWRRLAATFPGGTIFAPGKGGLAGFDFRANGEGWVGAAASKPIVYATFDGGTTWRAVEIPASPETVPSPAPSGKPYQPPAYNSVVYVLPGQGVLVLLTTYLGIVEAFTSFDGGRTWDSITFPPGPFSFGDISFVDRTHWWVSRANLLRKTSDGGLTWQTVVTVDPDVSGDWGMQTDHVIDARHAWTLMIGRTGTALAMTSDGGVHWRPANVPLPG